MEYEIWVVKYGWPRRRVIGRQELGKGGADGVLGRVSGDQRATLGGGSKPWLSLALRTMSVALPPVR